MSKFKFLIALLLVLFLFNCKKNRDVELPNEQDMEEKQVGEFSEETVRILDQISSVDFILDDILLPNGQTIAEYNRNRQKSSSLSTDAARTIEDMQIFKDMAEKAIYLANRSNFSSKFVKDYLPLNNGYPNPSQPNGLAYVYGGKTELSRTRPLQQKNANGEILKDKKGREVLAVTCASNLFGFDCAGYLEAILTAGKIHTPKPGGHYSANELRDASLITQFIQNNNISGLKVIDLGISKATVPQTGDIVYGGYKEIVDKKTGVVKVVFEHIGIALKQKDGSVGIFQSNGAPKYSCEENSHSGRGPRGLNLSEYKLYFKGKIGYLRFQTEVTATLENLTPAPLSGNINEYVLEPIKVKVVDDDGKGYAGATVTFNIKTGGGSVDQSSITTLDDGFAQTRWKLGPESSQTLEINATIDGKKIENSPITLTANTCQIPDVIEGYSLLGSYLGHKYFISTSSVNWTTANSNANTLAAHLLTIGDAGENSFILSTTSAQAWIGLSKNSDTFQWVTAEPVSFTNWSSGEPNNSGGFEDYAIINWTPGTWNDLADSWSFQYIIEFDCNKP